MAKLSTIYDPFDGDGLDTVLWNDSNGVTQNLGDGYATVAASGAYDSFLGFTPPSRDFAEDTFTWEWTYPSAPVTANEQYCAISNGVSGEEFQFGRYSTSLGYFVGAADGFTPWSDTDHRWCRIRTTSTQVFFETSSDGSAWVNPFSGGGVVALPAWDLSEVQVHFVNAFYDGTGGGDMRIQTVGLDSGTLSGSLAGALGGITTDINASLSSAGTVAGSLGGLSGAGTGRLVSRASLAGSLGGMTAAMSGMFESSAEDVTVSLGSARVAHLAVGAPTLSPAVAGPVVERNP